MSKELAKQAVACKHWRWMAGMRSVDGAQGFRVYVVSHGYPSGVDEHPPEKLNVDLGLRWIPDLTDPATLGCLLALVREAWGERTIGIEWENGTAAGWLVTGIEHNEISGDTEAEALVAALEAAP